MANQKVLITQTGSAIRREKSQADTLLSLGLGKIGRERTHLATPSIIGMVRKVQHLVKVKPVA